MVDNWPVKALSIAIALVLFIFHQLNTTTTRPLLIPLTVQTNSVLVPASAYQQNVRVRLRSEDGNIRSITEDEIEAYVDITRYEDPGSYSAPVHIRRKGIALSIEPLEITVSPSRVSLQLDRKMSKNIPVTAFIIGRVADGYDLISYSIHPLEITVTGPQDLLGSLSGIETEVIDLDGRNYDFTAEVNVINPNPLFILRGNGTVDFSCMIRPSVLVRSIESIPIMLIGLNADLEADVGGKTGSIRIEGDQVRLDEFVPPRHLLSVDCTGISGPGTYTLPVRLTLSQDFTLLRHEPDELSLTVALKDGR